MSRRGFTCFSTKSRNSTYLHRLNNNHTTPVSHNGIIWEVLCCVRLMSADSRGGAAPSARLGQVNVLAGELGQVRLAPLLDCQVRKFRFLFFSEIFSILNPHISLNFHPPQNPRFPRLPQACWKVQGGLVGNRGDGLILQNYLHLFQGYVRLIVSY